MHQMGRQNVRGLGAAGEGRNLGLWRRQSRDAPVETTSEVALMDNFPHLALLPSLMSLFSLSILTTLSPLYFTALGSICALRNGTD